jgi:hypothetical protein
MESPSTIALNAAPPVAQGGVILQNVQNIALRDIFIQFDMIQTVKSAWMCQQ